MVCGEGGLSGLGGGVSRCVWLWLVWILCGDENEN